MLIMMAMRIRLGFAIHDARNLLFGMNVCFCTYEFRPISLVEDAK